MSLPAPNSITPLSPRSYYDSRAGEGAPNSTQSPPLSPRSYYANRAGEIKPTINLSLVDKRAIRGPTFPAGTFSKNRRRLPLKSKRWGKAPFFSNAKPASMLERGLKRSTKVLVLGEKGILTINDGPEEEVEVVNVTTKEVVNVTTKQVPKKVSVYTFKNNSGELFEKDDWDRFEEWDFYMVTEAKPFAPEVRKGGKKKSRKTRRKTRSSRK